MFPQHEITLLLGLFLDGGNTFLGTEKESKKGLKGGRKSVSTPKSNVSTPYFLTPENLRLRGIYGVVESIDKRALIWHRLQAGEGFSS